MEGSSTKKEEEVPERNAMFYLCHPCYFLEETLRAVVKCLGLEIGTNKRDHKSSVVKSSSSDSEEDPITPEGNNASKDQKSYHQEEVIICAEEQSAKQECSTSQSFELITSLIIKRLSRGSDLSDGSGPKHN